MNYSDLLYLLRVRRYFELDGTEACLLRAAVKSTPWSYRFLGRTLSVAQLDAELGDWREWLELKAKIAPGDSIWPFTINPESMAMCQGYIVMRRRRPVGYVGTAVS